MKEWLVIALFAWLTGCGLLYEAINDPYRNLAVQELPDSR